MTTNDHQLRPPVGGQMTTNNYSITPAGHMTNNNF